MTPELSEAVEALSRDLGIPLEVDATSLADRPEALRHLQPRALNRLRGAFALAKEDPPLRAAIAREIRRMEIQGVSSPSSRAVTLDRGVLRVAIFLEKASGTFTESELCAALRDLLSSADYGGAWKDYLRNRVPRTEREIGEAFVEGVRLEIDVSGVPRNGETERVLESRLEVLVHRLQFVLGARARSREMRARLPVVRLRHEGDPAARGCMYENDVLEFALDLIKGEGNTPRPEVILDAIDRRLHLRSRGIVETVRYREIPSLCAEIGKGVRFTADWNRLAGRSVGEAKAFLNQVQVIGWAMKKFDTARLRERVREWRIEPVEEVEERELSADGPVIALRFCPARPEGGLFGVAELTEALTGLLAGMPVAPPAGPDEPDPDAVAEAERRLREVREDYYPELVDRIRRLVGAEIPVEVDWKSFFARPLAAENAGRGLEMIGAALEGIARSEEGSDEAVAEQIREAIRREIRAVRARAVERRGEEEVRLREGALEYALVPERSGMSGSDLEKALRGLLGADTLKSLLRARKDVLPAFLQDLKEAMGVPIWAEVDYASFRAPGEQDLLAGFEGDVLKNLRYFLTHLSPEDRTRVAEAITDIRIEHAPKIHGKDLFAAGHTLFFRVHLLPYPTVDRYDKKDGWVKHDVSEPGVPKNFSGTFSYYELEQDLPLLAASLPGIGEDESLRAWDSEGGDLDGFRAAGFPLIASRLREAVDQAIEIEIDWSSLASAANPARDLCAKGLYPLLGVLRTVSRDPLWSAVAPSFFGVRIRHVARLEERGLKVDKGILDLAVAFDYGLAGRDRPAELLEGLRLGLGLDILARIREAEGHEIPFVRRMLREKLDLEFEMRVDSSPIFRERDPRRRVWAAMHLGVHGVRNLGYAISGLCEKSAKFRKDFVERVAGLQVELVEDPGEKGLLAAGSTIIHRLAPYEGSDGWLTIDEMKSALPGIVSKMAKSPPRMTLREEEGRREIEEFRAGRFREFVEEMGLPMEVAWETIPWEGFDAWDFEREVLRPIRDALGSDECSFAAARVVKGIRLARKEEATASFRLAPEGVLEIVYGESMPEEEELAPAFLGLFRKVLPEDDPAARYGRRVQEALEFMRSTASEGVMQTLKETFRSSPELELDWASFVPPGHSEEEAAEAIQGVYAWGVVPLLSALVGKAVTDVAFKKAFPRKVRSIRIEHVDGTRKKGLRMMGKTLVYRCHAYAGEAGYLDHAGILARLEKL